MITLRNAIAILLLVTGAATAQTEPDSCPFIAESPESCIRFVGCINSDGAYFTGTSLGWLSGTVYGKTSEGSTCEGTWENSENGDKGVGNFNCDNGENAIFKYFPRGEEFTVLSGVAISSEGRRMITWAGVDLQGYLREKFPDGDHPGFQCGETWVPYPTVFPEKHQ
jgi:hypothetical protein